MEKGRIFLLVALGAGALALLLHIMGVATNAWISSSSPFGEASQGLWKSCFAGTCADIPDIGITDRLKAARAMEILAILVAVAGLVLLCLRYFLSSLSDNKIVYILCPILMGAAGVLGIIGVPVFCQNSVCGDNGGYSLALTILACIVYIVAIVPLSYLAKGLNGTS